MLDYAKALELDETLASDVYVNRGVAYLAADEIQRAIKDFDRALLIEPDDPTALANRGLAKARSGTLSEGLIDLDAAIAIAPRNFFFGFMTRGLVRALAGQLEGSLEDYGRANRIRPDRVEPLFQRALVQLQTGMPGQALKDLDQAISISPAFARAYAARSAAHRELGEIEAAEADIAVAISLGIDPALVDNPLISPLS